MSRTPLLALGVLLAVSVPGSAGAIAYTLLDPIIIDGSEFGNPGVLGRIDPVTFDGSIFIDPLGETNRDVETSPSRFFGQDVFVFEVTLNVNSTSIDELGVTVGVTNFFGNPVGGGYYADAGVAPTGNFAALGINAGTIAAFNLNVNQPVLAWPLCSVPSNVLTCTGYGGTRFSFDTPIAANQTSVRLFVTHEPAGTAEVLQTVSFMVSSGTDFTVQGQIVPEPSTVLLLAGGLLMLLGAGRRLR